MTSSSAVSFVTRRALSALFVVLAVSVCLAQSGSTAPQSGQAPQSAAGSPASSSAASAEGFLDVRLDKALHSKKLKEGDAVVAHLVGGAAVHDARGRSVRAIPRGSKVIGRVTEAKARSNGDPISSLGIIFEKIGLHDGQELAIKGFIYAISVDRKPPMEAPQDSYGDPPPSYSPGDRLMTGNPYPQNRPPLGQPTPMPDAVAVPDNDKAPSLGYGVVSSTTRKEVELDLDMKLSLAVTIM